MIVRLKVCRQKSAVENNTFETHVEIARTLQDGRECADDDHNAVYFCAALVQQVIWPQTLQIGFQDAKTNYFEACKDLGMVSA